MKIKDIKKEDYLKICAGHRNCKRCPFYDKKIKCADVMFLSEELRKNSKELSEYLEKDIEMTNENEMIENDGPFRHEDELLRVEIRLTNRK